MAARRAKWHPHDGRDFLGFLRTVLTRFAKEGDEEQAEHVEGGQQRQPKRRLKKRAVASCQRHAEMPSLE